MQQLRVIVWYGCAGLSPPEKFGYIKPGGTFH